MTAIVVASLLVLAGCACALAGVYLLAGLGWTLLASSALLFGGAGILWRGLISG